MKVDVQKEDNGKKGRFFAKLDDKHEAEMTFVDLNDKLRICDHTGVPEGFEGQGVAFQLLEALVADARETHMQYVPLCPYVAVQFRKHPEWSDVFVKN